MADVGTLGRHSLVGRVPTDQAPRSVCTALISLRLLVLSLLCEPQATIFSARVPAEGGDYLVQAAAPVASLMRLRHAVEPPRRVAVTSAGGILGGRMSRAGVYPWPAFVAGVAAGGVFCVALWAFDIGGLQSLIKADRSGIIVTTAVAPLLVLFGISAFATYPFGDDSPEPGRLLRSLRPARVAAARRPRRPPRG